MNSSTSKPSHTVAIIGDGPAGLMAADVLSQAQINVHLYDSMPSVGRKFLMAGKGGMNITHAEPFEVFVSRYGPRQQVLQTWLNDFGPEQLRAWLQQLGIETFVGSSNRVFPTDLKAAPLLRLWLQRLRKAGVNFHMRHQWSGWLNNDPLHLRFTTPETEKIIQADAVILALGGASWAKLGSTGAWVELIEQQGVPVAALKPANCGFETPWSTHFKTRFAGHPVKTVSVSFEDVTHTRIEQTGEFLITETGIEGSLIYALSAPLREKILAHGAVTIYLDLAPERSLTWLNDHLNTSRAKTSLANHLRKRVNISGVKAGLLRECLNAQDFNDIPTLCNKIKALPITLNAIRPLNEAISCAGGITFETLNTHLMLNNLPGVFCAGEMLDWEAPTGGYLLTACFATGYGAGLGVLDWLSQ